MVRFGLAGLVALSAIALGACGEEMDPASRVVDFRLLAVRADKPYAAPGESVELTTLSHEPFGRPITWGWATCVRPDETTVNGCLAKVVADAKASGQSPFATVGAGQSTFTTTIPANVLDGVRPETAASAFVGVVTVACPGTIETRDLTTLRQGDLPFRCIEAGTNQELAYDRFVVSTKRIFLRRTDRNQNPTVAGVNWDGAPWPEDEVKEVTACDNDPISNFKLCEGGEEHQIAAVIPEVSAESGVAESGAAFREDVIAQYYASEGLFEFDARTRESPTTNWVARAKAKGQELTLWFVVRENRGGVTWTTRRVRVR